MVLVQAQFSGTVESWLLSRAHVHTCTQGTVMIQGDTWLRPKVLGAGNGGRERLSVTISAQRGPEGRGIPRPQCPSEAKQY